jgi:hypothetical protein
MRSRQGAIPDTTDMVFYIFFANRSYVITNDPHIPDNPDFKKRGYGHK